MEWTAQGLSGNNNNNNNELLLLESGREEKNRVWSFERGFLIQRMFVYVHLTEYTLVHNECQGVPSDFEMQLLFVSDCEVCAEKRIPMTHLSNEFNNLCCVKKYV